MPALIYMPGSDKEQQFPLQPGRNSIGRERGNQVRLNRGDVSRRHAEIFVTPEQVLLKDLRSSNHCFVNGRQVHSIELNDGDEVRVGGMRLTYAAAVGAAEDADALAAEIAANGQPDEGVTPARRAELQRMVANLSRRSNTVGATLLRVPDGWPAEPELAKLQVLLAVANGLSTLTGVTERMQQALELVLEYLGVDRAAVLDLHDAPAGLADGSAPSPAGDLGDTSATAGTTSGFAAGCRPRPLAVRWRSSEPFGDGASFYDAGMVSAAVAKGGPALSVDRGIGDDGTDARVHVALCVPLGSAAADAALYVDNRSALAPYTQPDMELVAAVAAQVGIALANARALDRLLGDGDAAMDAEEMASEHSPSTGWS